MTDNELAEFLGLQPEDAAKIIPKLTSKRRLAYEHMAQVVMELALWQAGVGPRPKHVIICKERPKRRK